MLVVSGRKILRKGLSYVGFGLQRQESVKLETGRSRTSEPEMQQKRRRRRRRTGVRSVPWVPAERGNDARQRDESDHGGHGHREDDRRRTTTPETDGPIVIVIR
jgi:hypothetical protein